MKKLNIGINGFGRIGRAIFRNNLEKKYFNIVAINDINPDINSIAYLLNYDTLYGKAPVHFHGEINTIAGDDGSSIRIFNKHQIDETDWASMSVDFIIDTSGTIQNAINSRNLVKNKVVKKVFITHDPEPVDFSMVLGANESYFDIDKHRIISTSICDATAIAPVLKIINSQFGIEHGYITTLHPWLGYQNLLDGAVRSLAKPGETYNNFALGRSSAENLIPKSTTAVISTCKVLAEENITTKMIGSFSYRTPTAIVGSADITLSLKKTTTAQDVISIFEQSVKSQQWSIINNNAEPLVSLDYKKSEYSAIIDHRWTNVINNNMLKLVLWYDNEWGYSSRVLDQIKFAGK